MTGELTMVRRGAVVLISVMALFMVSFTPAEAAFSYAAPSSFKATTKSNAFITFTWKRTSGLNRYAIQYSKSSNFSNPSYRVPDNVTTQALATTTIHGLDPSTKYYFRIRSTFANGSNASDWSTAINSTTNTYVYSAPSKPTFSNVLSSSADLKWSETPNAGQYRVRYSTSSTFATASYAYFTDNAGTVSGLNPNTTYYFQVRALETKTNPDDNNAPYLLTGYSATASTKTASTFTQSPATGFKLLSVAKDKIVLQWKAVPTANIYRIQQWQVSTSKRYAMTTDPDVSISTSGGVVTATLTKFKDTATGASSAFTAGKVYSFRVSSYLNATNISDYTANTVTATAGVYPLPYPTGLSVDSVGPASITVSFDKVAGASSYRLQYRKVNTTGEIRYLYNVCGTGSPVTCTSNGNRYSFTLTNFASNSVGVTEAIKANTVYYMKLISQQPTPPPGMVADAYLQFDERASDYPADYLKATTAKFAFAPPALQSTLLTTSSIGLQWSAVGSGNSYVVERSKDTLFAKIDGTQCVSTNFTTMTGLTNETRYYFRVRAVNNCTTKTAISDNSTYISARTTANVGSLQGQVTNGGPLTSGQLADAQSTIIATAYADNDGQTGSDIEVAGASRVSSNGSYTITGLTPGKYRIYLTQIGGKNYTSPWLAASTYAWNDEHHKFMVASKLYTVTSGLVTAVDDGPVGPGAKFNGTVKRVTGGTAVANLLVTAIAAPRNPADTDPPAATREVQDSQYTDDTGHYSFTGLFPGKYKFSFTKSAYTTYGVWVSPVETKFSNPALVFATTVCLTSESTCVATPGANDYNDN